MIQHYTRVSLAGTLLLAAACTLASCEGDGDLAAPDALVVTDADEDGHTALLASGNEGEVTTHLDRGGINFDLAESIDFLLPDGTTEPRVLVEGDLLLTPAEYAAMKPAPGELQARQYRTFNLVSSPRTIRVLGYTGGGGQGLTSTARTALQWAVNNYNALDIGLTFTLTFGTNTGAADMVIYRNPNESGAGGVAGFPSGGRPNKYIQLYAGLDGYDTNVQEHVITHEIGHSVGLRHTDYATRQSCGQSGEGAGADGAVRIPGTPSGYDANSIMLACFGANEDGEFGFYDRVALEYLY